MATADVTLRRLQHFRTTPGKSYVWRAVQGQRVVASGAVVPDASNLITIHKLMLTTRPLTLRVEDSSVRPKIDDVSPQEFRVAYFDVSGCAGASAPLKAKPQYSLLRIRRERFCPCRRHLVLPDIPVRAQTTPFTDRSIWSLLSWRRCASR